MGDAGYLARVECAARVQAEHDRGGRLLLFADKDRRLGDREADTGRLNRADRLYGPRQFAFQSALVVHLFGKLADPELLVFHQFETDHAAAGQTL